MISHQNAVIKGTDFQYRIDKPWGRDASVVTTGKDAGGGTGKLLREQISQALITLRKASLCEVMDVN